MIHSISKDRSLRQQTALSKGVACLVAAMIGQGGPSTATAATAQPPIRGLVGVQNVDQWTVQLFTAPNTQTRSTALTTEELTKAYKNAPSVNEWFEQSLLPLSKSSDQMQDYKDLADFLFELRETMRREPLKNDGKDRKQTLFLLQTLLEETLAAIPRKFGADALPEFFYKNKSIGTDGCYDSTGASRVTTSLLGLSICQGDVVAMKGTAGTSSLLARMSELPGAFSHSTIATVEQAGGKVQFIEALIEDGLKLRDPWEEIEQRLKKRIAVYRYVNQHSKAATRARRTRVIDATDLFLARMKETQQAEGGAVDLTNRASFPYNFAFDVTNRVKYFCSQVAFEIYNLAMGNSPLNIGAPLRNLSNRTQAYPKTFWSTMGGAESNFFSQYLGMNSTSYPAPSDIEMHPDFQVVGYFMHSPSLVEDRIDNALVDVVSHLIVKGDADWKKILGAISKHGQREFSKADFEQIVAAIRSSQDISPEVKAKLEKLWAQLPQSSTLNQIAFFAIYNEVLTPQVRKLVLANEEAKFSKDGRPFSPGELRGLIASQISQGRELPQQFLTIIGEITKVINDCKGALGSPRTD